MKILLLVFLLLLISGCATKEHIQEVSLPKETPLAWKYADLNRSLPISDDLLAWVNDEHLTQLVHEALENNPNLQATALRLNAARQLNRAEHAKKLPSAGLSVDSARSNSAIDPLSGENITQNTHRASFGVSWELDIWGRIADENRASDHQLQMQELDYRYAKDALSARVIQSWIELAGIENSIAIENERLDTFTHIENVLIERYRYGIGDLDELSSAKSRSQIAKTELYEQSNLKKRIVRKLEVLLGRYPKTAINAPKQLPDIAIGSVDVPLNTLAKRPDIRAAIHNVAASRHLGDAAFKARLPQLNLSADLFRSATTLGSLGGSQNYFSVLGELFAPLYDGGRLKREEQAAAYEADATLKELHVKVLEALKEGEDLLANEQTLSRQITALSMALKESRRSSSFYVERYRNGLGTLQTVLIAKEQEMALKRQLNDITTLRLSNRIDLSLAVGMSVNENQRSHHQ